MRVFNTIRNSCYALSSYLVVGVLSVIVRRVFLKTLSAELLGYEGLFSNLFAIIALADLGMETVILFRLFPAFAEENHQAVNEIMTVYKYLYKLIGIIIAVIGLVLLPFLPSIIKDGSYDFKYVYGIYFVQLIGILCTYFLAYKRIIFIVDQKEYICTKIDFLLSIVFSFLKITVLIYFKNYFLYLICGLLGNIISNIVISKKVNYFYGYLQLKKHPNKTLISELGIKKDIKNNITQKVCGIIYGGTDNILVSSLIGIEQVGLLSNYLLISGYITSLYSKILKPFQAAIGNYIYTNNNQSGDQIFRMFDFLSFIIACITTCCYFNLFNPAISLLFGREYLLSDSFVAFFCLNQYIMWNHQFLSYYRYSFGKYELDRFPIFMAAVLNISFSIILSKPLGIAGIMLGTAIGHLGFWFGRVYVVYKEYIQESVVKYIIRQVIRLILCFVCVLITSTICSLIPISALFLIAKMVISVFIPLLVICLLNIYTDEMKSVVEYSKMIVLKKY